MIRLVLDTLGSDQAPLVEIEGVKSFLAENKTPVELILVGDESVLKTHLQPNSVNNLKFFHAPQRITMGEKASRALRERRDSTIAKGLEILKKGESDAFISAGNTGAVLTFAFATLGRIPGVRRPAIGVVLPTLKGFALVLDVGANVQVRPVHILEFAIMGSIFARAVLKKENPKVGLLSIGEEMTKGDHLIFEAKKLLQSSHLVNFQGHIEGNHIMEGEVDVVVTDGFTGNVLLKFGEGAVNLMTNLFKEELKRNPLAMLGVLFLRPILHRIRRRLDYEEYGGALLIGIDGVVIVAHGRSTARAIKNALHLAKTLVEQQVNRHIKEEIQKALAFSE